MLWAMTAPPSLGPVIERGGGRLLVGTCSWTDTTLTDQTEWYPKRSMSAAERLAFYAARYPIAEADSTYYFPPRPELTKGWVERTPPGFTMNVKAFSLFTGHPTRLDVAVAGHPRRPAGGGHPQAQRLRAPPRRHRARRGLEALPARVRPLDSAGKLGAVLMQYPKWFTPKRANREALAQMREQMEDLPVCVEFRAPGWLGPDDRDRTLHQLRDLGLTLVVLDAPRVSKLLTVLEVTTEQLAVVRFHGRADDRWDDRTGSAAERFRYLYTRRQLRTWVAKIDELASQAREVHVLMNNCYQDYGVRNAADLQDLLLA